MTDFNEAQQDPAVLEVIENLLNLCMEREEEIAHLSRELDKLKAYLQLPGPSSSSSTQKIAQPNNRHGVLVVDDSSIMRSRLVSLLLCNGFRIVGEAENGLRAVQMFKERRPAVVTMDIDMPVMDGYEATRQIHDLDPEVKVIVISQLLDRSMILNALNAGAVDFLVKPVQIDRLLQLVGRFMAAFEPAGASS
jgi:two-component system chemotaxis response regulator CheY